MGEKGVCSSSSALLILEDLTPGVKMVENIATSSLRDLLSLGGGSGPFFFFPVVLEKNKS